MKNEKNKQHQNIITVKANNLIINSNFSEQRIDNFLFNQLKHIPKSRIYSMLRHGEVRVNKGRIKPDYKLQTNDVVRVPPFWDKLNNNDNNIRTVPGSNLINLLVNNIIFEDEKILVINKPAGIAAHSGSGINFGVIEILRAARPDLPHLELAHRLDRDTSGCLILAKNRMVLRELHELIRNAAIYKKYILLVRGEFTKDELIVDASLLKNQLSSGERIVMPDSNGKKSLTIFHLIRKNASMSLLEADLKTGRTHQIRVHAAHIKHPIAGDDKYGDKVFNNQTKALGLKRLFLHAKEIRFTWSDGQKVNLVASLDKQLEVVLKKIFI